MQSLHTPYEKSHRLGHHSGPALFSIATREICGAIQNDRLPQSALVLLRIPALAMDSIRRWDVPDRRRVTDIGSDSTPYKYYVCAMGR